MTKPIAADRVRLKRAYEPAARGDGSRVLVDRLWPRGMTKDAVAIHEWIRDAAPSAALRRWFGHDPARWQAFRRRYASELRDKPELLARMRALAENGPVTLVYAARDEAHNHAIVLRDMLVAKPRRRSRGDRAGTAPRC